jgi:hypothetical protein
LLNTFCFVHDVHDSGVKASSSGVLSLEAGSVFWLGPYDPTMPVYPLFTMLFRCSCRKKYVE